MQHRPPIDTCSWAGALALVGLLAAASTCTPATSEEQAPPQRTSPATPPHTTSPITPPTITPTASSSAKLAPAGETAAAIIAVGDLHGDYQATREVLRLARLIDEEDRWIGGRTQLVQLGDFLDRGDGERQIIQLFERLRQAAEEAGGAVHILNGNHELMNAARRFPYVTPKGFAAFTDFDDGDPTLTVVAKARRGRWAAFRPGGDYAKVLADYPVVLRLGDTVFVHGGLLPKHAAYGVDRINQRARDFLLGSDPKAWGWFAAWDSPVNSRHYADRPGAGDCYLLKKTLAALNAKRMVVAHTVQLAGISSYCGGRVWAVDVGLSACCGNNRQALSLRGDKVAVLKATSSP